MNNTSEKRFSLRCAAYVFLIKNNKLLLLRRKNTGWEDGKYGVPSGHLEENESLLSAAIREAKEESGVDISKKDLRMVHVMHRRVNHDYIDIYFVADKWKGEPFISESKKSDDIQWADINNFPENTLENIKIAFENYKKNIIYSQFGWD